MEKLLLEKLYNKVRLKRRKEGLCEQGCERPFVLKFRGRRDNGRIFVGYYCADCWCELKELMSHPEKDPSRFDEGVTYLKEV